MKAAVDKSGKNGIIIAGSDKKIMQSIEEKDLILLRHEYHEHNLMVKGLSYIEAHEKTQKLYNYKKAVDDWREKQ